MNKISTSISIPAGLEAFSDRLCQGCDAMGIDIEHHQVALMACHARELMLWNKKINLTAIRDPREMAEKHFLDAVGVHQFVSAKGKIMDMGTGGGFPSIPLKVLDPSVQYCLVDSVRKKVSFLNHVIRTLGLGDIQALHTRVEDLALDPEHANGYDAVISRGFANLEKFVDLALPLLKPGGHIYALKGKDGVDEISPALESGFHITQDHYQLPFEKSDRCLIRLKERQGA